MFDYTSLPTYGKRRTVFAGTWYDSDSRRLTAQIQDFLHKAHHSLQGNPCEIGFSNNEPPSGPAIALIVPHAGYMFSGQTAAYAYAKAKERELKRVFLLGPSHYTAFHGAALSDDKVLCTPIGNLHVDSEAVTDLAGYPLFQRRNDVHGTEHSLELQLPLIRQTFGNVKVIPIIVGTLREDMEIRLLAQILNRYITENDIVIVSSDFTHFGPRYQYEPFDSNIRENIHRLDEEAFQCLRAADLKAFLNFQKQTGDTICGLYPCAVLLAMLPHGAKGALLHYETSMDSFAEDDHNSVSYMAIVFSGAKGSESLCLQSDLTLEDTTDSILSADAKQSLLKIARDAVIIYVRENRIPSLNELCVPDHTVFNSPMGAFCTLFKAPDITNSDFSANKKELRGCIGYIWPVKPLIDAVVENAIAACSRDHRFQPITCDELNELRIEINVLTQPKRVDSVEEIVIGKDGIVMYKDGRQAVFLPSVATEFGWNLEQTLIQLSIKAGCGANGWKEQAKFDIFQSQCFGEKTFLV